MRCECNHLMKEIAEVSNSYYLYWCQECGILIRNHYGFDPEINDIFSPKSSDCVELLRELLNASAPYLRRKKMTARHECNALNDVWTKCAEHLEKQNEKSEA